MNIEFKVTNGNSKLGAIPAINLPAIKTCREDAPCRKLCYANKGNFLFKHVKNCYERNLKVFLENPSKAENDILSQIPSLGMIRWHASGDIVNREYLDMMVRIAKQRKQTRFLCFTKKYEMINQYLDEGNTFPKNLKIVFSGWYGLDVINPYNIPTAYIKLKQQEDNRIKKSALDCIGNCMECGGACWFLKKGQQVFFKQH